MSYFGKYQWQPLDGSAVKIKKILIYATQTCQNNRPISYEQNVGYAGSTQFKMPSNALVIFCIDKTNRMLKEDSWSVDHIPDCLIHVSNKRVFVFL